MTMNRHEPYEELISASLNGELTAIERQRLDAHLDACATFRATLAAFAEQRRIMAGLRQVAPPRDLGARVRYGIERGRLGEVPWWKRPAVMFVGVGGSLAAVAGALLALVLLNGSPQQQPVGAGTPSPTPALTASASPTPSAALATEAPSAPEATLPPPPASLAPNATPAPTPPPPTPDPATSPTPEPSPEPDVYVAVTGPADSLTLSVQEPQPAGASPAPSPIVEVHDGPAGPAVAAELSPDGQWLAYVVELGQSGMNEVRATRVADAPADSPEGAEAGETVVLGRSLAGSPFLERLVWSADARRLAYTLADPDAEGATDAWLFLPETGEFGRLTDVGGAFAASWVERGDQDGQERAPLLWISVADDRPTSVLVELPEGDSITEVDLAEDAIREADDVFLPMLSPNGSFAIYWSGRMAQEAGAPWGFVEGGMPWLSEHRVRDESYAFANERPLFSDLEEDRDMFTSAAITWGPDGDAYAVWDAMWTGVSQGADGTQYPDPLRVYLGHAADARGLTQLHALDEGDLLDAEGDRPATVVDAKIALSGRHLLVTVRRPVAGDLSVPRADLLFVTRNTGSVADEVEALNFADDGWFGPAAFDESWREDTGD
jgi:hypothetical protein